MANSQRVRPFTGSDIPQVAGLHRNIYRQDEQPSPELERCYRGFFQDVFLENPWYDDRVSSLVCEDGTGRIIGFLGAMPRPMRLEGRPIRAAVCSMLMVDPQQRNSLASVQLIRSLLSGPQDLTFADESTSPSRKLWERLGGTTSMLNSMHWIRPLKPAGLLNVRLSQHPGLRPLGKLSAPLCWAADAAITHLRFSPYRFAAARLAGEELDTRTLLECSTGLYDSQALRPEYDERSLRWLLELASHDGGLEKIVVRNSSGSAVGFYVYHLNRDGIAEVLQMATQPAFTKDVVDHLLNRAARQGAVAVTGRLDPRYIDELGSSCLMRARYWMLVHSRNPHLLSAIEGGRPYLTRLEGEWCLQFHASRYRHRNIESRPAVQALPAPGDSTPRVQYATGGVELIEKLADEWRRLCDEASREPFYRPEWVAAYVRAFAPDEKVVLITVRSGGVLQAVLPMIEERSHYCGIPVTKLRGAANAHSCRFDLVRSAGPDGDAATAAIWRYLSESPGWDLIEFPYVVEGAALEPMANTARLERFPIGLKESMRTPYVPLSWIAPADDPILYHTNPRFRAQVRRKRRQIETGGKLEMRRVTTADPALLQAFYDLEGSGWKGKQGTAIACSEDTRRFYNEIGRYGEQFGYLTLYFLEYDGRPIAAQFGITHGGRYFMPKLAFDENYSQYGPGHLLIHEILRDCVERGLSEYDFTGPWAEYKAKWTSSTRLHSTITIFRHGFFGEALHTAKFKVEEGVKDVLRPLLGRG